MYLFPQCCLLFFVRFTPGVILRELIRLSRRFWQAIAFATGQHIVQTGLQADAMAQRDNHWFDMGACAQRCPHRLTFKDQWYPGSCFLAEGLFIVMSLQDRLG